MKSRIKLDCEAGYTLRQAIRRSVARDPVTQADRRTVELKGWRLSKEFKKMLAEESSLPDGIQAGTVSGS